MNKQEIQCRALEARTAGHLGVLQKLAGTVALTHVNRKFRKPPKGLGFTELEDIRLAATVGAIEAAGTWKLEVAFVTHIINALKHAGAQAARDLRAGGLTGDNNERTKPQFVRPSAFTDEDGAPTGDADAWDSIAGEMLVGGTTEDGELLEELREAIASLPEKERALMTLMYGAEGDDALTMTAACARLGVTIQNARTLHGKAVARLKEFFSS